MPEQENKLFREKISTYVTLIDVTDAFVTFETKGNILRIPPHRVLKLKEAAQ